MPDRFELSAIFRRSDNMVSYTPRVRLMEKTDDLSVTTSTLGSSLGTGGMATKLIAAELATAAGVTTVVMHAGHVQDIFGIIEGGIPPSAGDGSETPRMDEGPLCTRFLRREDPIKE